MEEKALKILTAIRKKLPNAKVFWSKEPGSDPWSDSCTLTAISRTDQAKSYSMVFKNGLGEHPNDETIETFLDHAKPELS